MHCFMVRPQEKAGKNSIHYSSNFNSYENGKSHDIDLTGNVVF